MGLRGDGDDRPAVVADPGTVALKLVTAGTALAVLGTVHAAVNAALLRRPLPAEPVAATVSVLVPARNEAATIAACLASIAGSDGVAEVIVLDDGSSDGTAEIARSAGATVLAGTPVPAGWLGKPHACRQLAEAAHGDVLVFVDADVRLAPGAVPAAVALLDALDLDLVTPFPRQLAVSAAERLVQPLLQWTILTTLPLRAAERSARPSLVAANGQFLVVRRAAYERAGGHVPDAVLDDVALLRAVKRSGGRGVVVDGTALAGCRMYDGWPAIRDGYGKSLWSALGPAPAAAATMGVFALAYVLPALAALRGSRTGLAGYLAGVLGRVVTGRRTGARVWPDALAHPLSVAALVRLTAGSYVAHRRGRLTWKGRPVG